MKINVDKFIFKSLITLFVIKLLCSYLSIELGWWQRHLETNFEKHNFLGLPKDTTKILEFLIIPLIAFYIAKNFKFLKSKAIVVPIVTFMILLNIVTSIYNGVDLIKSIEYTLKFASPVFFFIVILVHYYKYDFDLRKLVVRLLTFCSVLVLLGYMFFDNSYNHDEQWFPIYFASVHTHSYVISIIGIGFSYLLLEKKKYIYFFMFSLSYFVFMYIGHRIRTPMVFYLVYLIAASYTIHNIFKALWVKLLINIPIVVTLFLVLNDSFDLNKFSSGRIVMYKAKYEMLKGYNFIEYLFGRGKGSDFIRTDYWWYSEKNSHNDILTFIVENGIPYALSFLGLIFILVIINGKVKYIYSGILIAYVFTSFLSNGMVLRPLASYLMFVVLAYISSKEFKKHVYKEEGG